MPIYVSIAALVVLSIFLYLGRSRKKNEKE